MIDEGPSPEDIQRFSDETGYCHHCGAEIWDQAEQCPRCKTYQQFGVRSRPPLEEWFRKRWVLFVVIVVLIAFLLIVI